VDYLFQNTASPFTDEVANFHLPEKFKIPDILTYTGFEDPIEHLEISKLIRISTEHLMKWSFPLTLSGKARDWFRKLLPSSVKNFDTLKKKFLTRSCWKSKEEACWIFTFIASGPRRIVERLHLEVQPREARY